MRMAERASLNNADRGAWVATAWEPSAADRGRSWEPDPECVDRASGVGSRVRSVTRAS